MWLAGSSLQSGRGDKHGTDWDTANRSKVTKQFGPETAEKLSFTVKILKKQTELDSI